MSTVLRAALLLFLLLPTRALSLELGTTAECTLGKDCFVQQFPDMDASTAVADPFCGSATYDGHDGLDLRILSLGDVARGVPVIAVAEGTVLRLRDGEPDRLIVTKEDRDAVADKECGNGLLIEHTDGFQTQYCHLRQGSISVAVGDKVSRGDRIGAIGASGMAEFPHVHLTVRKDGMALDPMTGRALAEGCLRDAAAAAPRFAPEVSAMLGRGETALLAAGLSGDVIDHNLLALDGPPGTATSGSKATVAWAWFINMRGGDRIGFRLAAPDGTVIVDHVADPVDRAKASFSAFAGKRGPPAAGNYELKVTLIRNGTAVLDRAMSITVE